MKKESNTIWTIGHSTRTLEEFLQLLKGFGVKHLVDIRHYPGSRRFPHFNKDVLAESLKMQGIKYSHIVELGGRRKPLQDSKNTAWRVEAFKGYADHMESDEFIQGINMLQTIASREPTAYMCSEAVWWSCHRALVSDYLKWKDWKVMHIMNAGKAVEHPYSKAAHISNDELSYARIEA